ncbi:hypothetical protein BDN70DRAFT_998426 [Pholiota conissans]|uniref:Uncharacterized protein n=1 Tax=Pholiota conissans TaxID=109636 RepID=A0A9P5YNM4_9AGAR|nr:hypothetical protein BDN70DRAFT_998426 [Pholiota conissans]
MAIRTYLPVVVYTLLFVGKALAAPTANESPIAICASSELSQSLALSSDEASQHDTRTVWNIFWSCISTIIACCWIAVHPNMLEPNAGLWRSTTHRLSHMTWMIIAPELMICWAIRQWLGARNLKKKAPFNGVDSGWTMTHGYFLQMGGFVLEGEEPDILSAERLIDLVAEKKVVLPQITSREIKDRSKRDGLSKLIAMGQTAWFLAQCISRKAQGLVTTELELVTIAFAALNVFIYFFWWDKPMDVQTTVTVPYLSKPAIPEQMSSQDEKDITVVPLQQTVSNGSNERKSAASVREVPIPIPTTQPLEEDTNESATCVHCIGGYLLALLALPWKLIKILFRRVNSMLFDSDDIEPGMNKIYTFYALDTTGQEQAIVLTCVCLIGIIFGGIHCFGWNYFFPSHAELVIWRISSVCISAVPAMTAIGAFSFYFGDELEDRSEFFSTLLEIFGGLLVFLGIAGVIPYVIARILLLVEALISLRDLPHDALLAVTWTSFLPHI